MRRARTDNLQIANQFVRFVASFLKTESLPQSPPDVCLQERTALRQSLDATVCGFRALTISVFPLARPLRPFLLPLFQLWQLRQRLFQTPLRRSSSTCFWLATCNFHSHPATPPAKGRALLTSPRQLTRRTDASDAGIQPKRHQQLRIGRVAARYPFSCFNRLMECRQIQLGHHRRHRSYPVRRHEIIRALWHPFHLPPHRLPQPHLASRFRLLLLVRSCTPYNRKQGGLHEKVTASRRRNNNIPQSGLE